MRRRTFLKSSLLIGTGTGLNRLVYAENPLEKKRVKKPHVIFIMTDQHRGDALGCMGN